MDPRTFPTKGNLMLAKNSLALARQGYDLMDKKRNILIRELMDLIEEARTIQEEIDSTFTYAYQCLQRANIENGISMVEQLAYTVPIENSITIQTRSIMGTEIPHVKYVPDAGQPTYAFSTTKESIDIAREAFRKVKDLTIKLSMVENAAYRLASNIKKTQKRANALQNITIPMYSNLVYSITNALEEKEREEFTRLKVIKQMKEKKEKKVKRKVIVGENLVTYITNLYEDSITRASNNLKKDNTEDKNIRYYGANPNNYVRFNNELWRIIGIFGNNVKLIRNDRLGWLSWDTSESTVNNGYGINQWGESKDTSGNIYEGADLQVYLNKMYYGGDACNDTVERTTTWTGYIGLQYITDYAYASSESVCETNMQEQDSSNAYICKNNNWMQRSTWAWYFSPFADGSFARYAWCVSGDGVAYGNRAANSIAVAPSIYLKSNVLIESGNGTSTDPYELSL